MPVKIIKNESALENLLKSGGLVVVGYLDGSDQKHGDYLNELSEQPEFERISFMRVDADCANWFATKHSIASAPAILIFGGENNPVIACSGDNIKALEQKLNVLSKKEPDVREQDPIDLVQHALDRQRSFCLNQKRSNPLTNCFVEDETVLKSHLDQKLIISLRFSRLVRVDSIMIKCPASTKIRRVRFYINRSKNFDFDEAAASQPVEIIDFAGDPLISLPNMEHKIVQNLVVCLDTDEYGAGVTEIQQLKVFGSLFELIADEDFKKPVPKDDVPSESSRSRAPSLSSVDPSVVNRAFNVDIAKLLGDQVTCAEVPQMLHPLKLIEAPDRLLESIHLEMSQRFPLYGGFPDGTVQETEKSKFVVSLLETIIKFVQEEKSVTNFFELRSRVHFKMILDGKLQNTYADHAIMSKTTSGKRICIVIECKAGNCDEGAKQLVAYSIKASEKNQTECSPADGIVFGFSTIATDFSMLRFDSTTAAVQLSEQFRFLFSRMAKSDKYKAQWKKENHLLADLLYTILTAEISK